jgi:hypothetical protein
MKKKNNKDTQREFIPTKHRENSILLYTGYCLSRMRSRDSKVYIDIYKFIVI